MSHLFFSTVAGLFVSDGTVAGTHSLGLQNIDAIASVNDHTVVLSGATPVITAYSEDGSASTALTPLGFTEATYSSTGAHLYLSGLDTNNTNELFVSDGTSAGTLQVSLPSEVKTAAFLGAFSALGGEYLEFRSSSQADLLYSYSASAGLAPALTSSATDGSASTAERFVPVSGGFVFEQAVSGLGNELWFSDGTTAGTHLIEDLSPGPSDGVQVGSPIASVRGTAFFIGTPDGTGKQALYETNGTAQGTSVVLDAMGKPVSGTGLQFLTTGDSAHNTVSVSGGRVQLSLVGADGQTQLILTDGSQSGTTRVSQVTYLSSPLELFSQAFQPEPSGHVLVTASSTLNGSGLNGSGVFDVDPVSGRAVLVHRDYPSTVSSTPILSVNGVFAFSDVNSAYPQAGNYDHELFFTDGTSSGTVEDQLVPFNPLGAQYAGDPNGANPMNFTLVGPSGPTPDVVVNAPASLQEGRDSGFDLSLTFMNVSMLNASVSLSYSTTSTVANGVDLTVPTGTYSVSANQYPAGNYTFDLGQLALSNPTPFQGTQIVAIDVSAPGHTFSNGQSSITVAIPILGNLFVGTPGNGVITGGDGHDILTGGGEVFRNTQAALGSDVITNFHALDTIDVTDASLATFSYTHVGTQLSFGGGTAMTLQGVPVGHLVVSADTTGGGGVDLTLGAHVEGLSDFNGDGHSDLLWRNVNSGAFTVWDVGGNGAAANTEAANVYGNGSVGNDWQIQGTLDFNGDGASDLLFRNVYNGGFTVWDASGSGFAANAYGDASVGVSWSVTGLGDFNGDGRDDLLWRNGNGALTEWQSTGTGFTPNVYQTQVDPSWHVVGVGDFNGDGMADVLWRNANGALTEWQSNGSGFTQNVFQAQIGTDWHVVAVADFNGDGRADVLFRNDGGAFTEWQSTGNGFVQNVYANNTVDNSWHVVGTGDFNDDGRADILWRNDGGAFTVWESTGSGFVANTLSDATVSNAWTPVTHHYDFV